MYIYIHIYYCTVNSLRCFTRVVLHNFVVIHVTSVVKPLHLIMARNTEILKAV